MITVPKCACGHDKAIARYSEDGWALVDKDGEVLDRGSSSGVEDLECARCGDVLRPAHHITSAEADLIFGDVAHDVPEIPLAGADRSGPGRSDTPAKEAP